MPPAPPAAVAQDDLVADPALSIYHNLVSQGSGSLNGHPLGMFLLSVRQELVDLLLGYRLGFVWHPH